MPNESYVIYGQLLMMKALPKYFKFDEQALNQVPVCINLLGLPWSVGMSCV